MAIPLYSYSAAEYFNQAIKQCCHESPQNFDLLDEILALISTDDVSVMPPPALAPLQEIQKIILDDFELRNYPSQSDV